VSSVVLLAGGAQCGVSYDAFFPWIWLQRRWRLERRENGAVKEKEEEDCTGCDLKSN
jgi:hypothetical protein